MSNNDTKNNVYASQILKQVQIDRKDNTTYQNKKLQEKDD